MPQENSTSSKRARLKNCSENLKHLVDDFIHHRIHCANQRHFDVMDTPKALQLVGMKNLPMRLDGKMLAKVLELKHNDQITIDTFCKLPQALDDPLMILRSRGKDGRINPSKCVIVTDLKDKFGGTIIVPAGMDFVDFQHDREEHRNKVLSFYGKSKSYTHVINNKYILQRMNEDDLMYINKKRTANWLSKIAEAPGGLRVRDPFDLSPIIPDESSLRKFKRENVTDSFRRPLREETTITVQQQNRLDAIYEAPMDTMRPEKIYRKAMMEFLDNAPKLTKSAVHQAERETILVLLEHGITKSRIKKILQERSPLCDTRQSKKDLEEMLIQQKSCKRQRHNTKTTLSHDMEVSR